MWGASVLHYAVRGQHFQLRYRSSPCSMPHAVLRCISFLVNFGACLWTLDNDGETALKLAHSVGNADIVRYVDYEMCKQVI